MPNQDGSLTRADEVALAQAFDRMISAGESAPLPQSLGMLAQIQQNVTNDEAARSSFMRVVEALSLDLLSHAVGGFSALTEQEQTASLLSVENSLPREFSAVLGMVRDIYYDAEQTPDRPSSFDDDSEIFGKISIGEELEPATKKRRIIRTKS
jgi:hypothetical protein